MTREQMIDALVERRVNRIFDCDAEIWIEARLRHGMDWEPYINMTDEEIREEYLDAFADEEDEA